MIVEEAQLLKQTIDLATKSIDRSYEAVYELQAQLTTSENDHYLHYHLAHSQSMMSSQQDIQPDIFFKSWRILDIIIWISMINLPFLKEL